MCGIVGFWSEQRYGEELVQYMANRLESRGPDDSGVWQDVATGLNFGHRRLSILDLSSAGHQPMRTSCGRFTLIYNGEIYNHMALREELVDNEPGLKWQGHSDTETLMNALRVWGVGQTLSRINGMFAFAWWDSAERKLFLARDRLGIKPLYYGTQGDAFFFSSELKAFQPHPEWHGEVCRNSLAAYMRHNYVPAPHCIIKGMRKLPPGTYVQVTARKAGEPICYWDICTMAQQRQDDPLEDAQVALEKFREQLRIAVNRRMLADVPLGAFLSGGYDSSLVSAVMQEQSAKPINTYSIGFEESTHNEAPHARQIAGHLKTNHTEHYVTPAEALEVIPRLPSIYDEPFSDSSQIPTSLLCMMARKHVTVSLSGDGGDELFGGYTRYAFCQRLWGRLGKLPPGARRLLAACVHAAPGVALERLQRCVVPEGKRIDNLADRLPRLAELMRQPDRVTFYRHLVSHFKAPDELVLQADEADSFLTRRSDHPELSDYLSLMQFLDLKTYLPDDILTKVDRASMACSLEVRVPLLDHEMVEFAFGLSPQLKSRAGQGKWLLRQLAHEYIPRELLERPKMGFGVPIESWLRGPLKDWAEALLSVERLKRDCYFDPAPIRLMWEEHQQGKRRWHYYLWDVLMFQAWLDEWQCGGNSQR